MPVIYEPAGRAREYAPLAANLYSGCSHGCIYCYAPLALKRRREAFHSSPGPRKGVLEALEKDARRLAARGERRPILMSFTSDPYQPCEAEFGLTRAGLEILARHGLRVTVLTKGGTRALRDLDLLARPGNALAATLTTLDPEESLRWEPEAALPADRIQALAEAKRAGLHTWVSLEPVLDPAWALEIIRATREVVDLYKVGRLNYHPRARRIDWAGFRDQAVTLLERLGKDYYIKADLRAA